MTSGLLRGQDVLTVPDMRAKHRAQRMGLGAGFLPFNWIENDLALGRLVVKQVEEKKDAGEVFLAWPTGHKGKALQWFLDNLEDEVVSTSLFNPPTD